MCASTNRMQTKPAMGSIDRLHNTAADARWLVDVQSLLSEVSGRSKTSGITYQITKRRDPVSATGRALMQS